MITDYQTETNLSLKKSFATVDDNNAVYHCKHAFNLDHVCTFAICNSCKIKSDETNDKTDGLTKRTRSVVRNNNFSKQNDPQGFKHALNHRYDNKKISKSHTDNICSHSKGNYEDLQIYCDPSYFEEIYLRKMRNDNESFPFKCNDCGLNFQKI